LGARVIKIENPRGGGMTRHYDSAQAGLAARFVPAARASPPSRASRWSTWRPARSFYLRFAGKDDLLLALLENVLREPAERIRAACGDEPDPTEAPRSAVWVLFGTAAASSCDRHPLVIDLVQYCRRTRPGQVWSAHGPLLAIFAELLTRAEAAGELRDGARPRPTAVLVVQVAMYLAQSTTVGQEDQPGHPLSADEVWDFCASGFARR
jgi:AcrR family transcriptional regulator